MGGRRFGAGLFYCVGLTPRVGHGAYGLGRGCARGYEGEKWAAHVGRVKGGEEGRGGRRVEGVCGSVGRWVGGGRAKKGGRVEEGRPTSRVGNRGWALATTVSSRPYPISTAPHALPITYANKPLSQTALPSPSGNGTFTHRHCNAAVPIAAPTNQAGPFTLPSHADPPHPTLPPPVR